jgi:hypothetical protein
MRRATAVAHARHPLALIVLSGLLLSIVPVVAKAETVLVTGANSGIGLEFT